MSKGRVSEVEAYIWIRNRLHELGWNTNSPTRDSEGQVYTQQTCHDFAPIADALSGGIPEYVIKLNEDAYWVIEAKAQLENLDQASKEAKEYGTNINEHGRVQAMIATGVAGNDIDRYEVRNFFFQDGYYQSITYNDEPLSGLLSPHQVQELLRTNDAQLTDLVIDEAEMLLQAEKINDVLHSASINKDERAPFIATILLSMLGDTSPNINADAELLVGDINNRAKYVLTEKGKPEYFDQLEIKLPSQQGARNKRRRAIVATITRLKELNLKTAMTTGTDVLGKFFEVFLKHGNGAKDLGIVFTPRHITSFAATVMGIDHQDIVYDPACGTGGFLISAMDAVREKSGAQQLENFKDYRIFGSDAEPKVAALAVVNMIFRNDGKNHIVDNDCFAHRLKPHIDAGERSAQFVGRDDTVDRPPVNKVLMNAPFSQNDAEEYEFVEHALAQMEPGGILFAIIPMSILSKSGKYREWRTNRLLRNHTLLAVTSLSRDFFRPSASAYPCGIFLKAKQPHPDVQNVLWARAMSDGRRLSKGRRIPDARIQDDFENLKNHLKLFISDPGYEATNVPKLQKAHPIDTNDQLSELLPERYLDQATPTIEQLKSILESNVRDALAFIIKTEPVAELSKLLPSMDPEETEVPSPYSFEPINVTSLFENVQTGNCRSLASLDSLAPGSIPAVSRSMLDQGIQGYYEYPDQLTVYQRFQLTVSTITGESFIQMRDFIAVKDVLILRPNESDDLATRFFMQLMINLESWRWSYGRECYKEKFEKTAILMPTTETGELDRGFMRALARQCIGFAELENYLAD